MLEQQTLTDPSVIRVLEPFAHVQIWWDGDAEQKAFAEALGQRKFPTLVFLDKNGQPVYSAIGYKKPLPFLAECVKASDLLGVSVPDEIRTAVAGLETKGTILTRTAGQPGSSKPAAGSPARTTATGVTPRAGVNNSTSSLFAFNSPGLKAPQPDTRETYNPLKEACFDISIGKVEKAINILNDFLPGHANNAEAHYLLAAAYVMTRKYELAGEQYRQVIKLAPDSQLGIRARAGLQKIGMNLP